MARRRRISPERIGRLLKRARDEMNLSQERCRKEFSGPDRGTLSKWESGKGLKQLRYVLRLAQRSPLLATNLLYLVDPNADSVFLRVAKANFSAWYLVNHLKQMEGVVMLPSTADGDAAAKHDANAAWHSAPTARAISEGLNEWVNKVGHEDVDPDPEALTEAIERDEKLEKEHSKRIRRVNSSAESYPEQVEAVERQLEWHQAEIWLLEAKRQYLMKLQALHSEVHEVRERA